MLWLYILLGLIALYILFIAVPTVVCVIVAMKRVDSIPFVAEKFVGTYYEPYRDELVECIDYFDRLKPETVYTEADDGTKLGALIMRNPGNRVIIFFHGFHGRPGLNFPIQAKYFLEHGYTLVMPSERAHVLSGGKFMGIGLTERRDVHVWIEKVREMMPDAEIALYGSSMGCSSIEFASGTLDPESVKCMILDCGYCCPYDQVKQEIKKKHLPVHLMMPVAALLFRVLNKEKLRQSVLPSLEKNKIPALFLHGKADTTVLPVHAEEAYAACGSEKELILVDNAPHTLAFAEGGLPLRDRLDEYIRNHFKGE